MDWRYFNHTGIGGQGRRKDPTCGRNWDRPCGSGSAPSCISSVIARLLYPRVAACEKLAYHVNPGQGSGDGLPNGCIHGSLSK